MFHSIFSIHSMSIENFKRHIRNLDPALKVRNIGRGRVKIYVGTNNNEASYINVVPHKNHVGHMYINIATTNNAWQKKGLSKYLTAAVIHAAKRAGFTNASALSVHMTFSRENEARARNSRWPLSSHTFSRLGFRRVRNLGIAGHYLLSNNQRHRIEWNINLTRPIPNVNTAVRNTPVVLEHFRP
jgi:hypothetical protein